MNARHFPPTLASGLQSVWLCDMRRWLLHVIHPPTTLTATYYPLLLHTPTPSFPPSLPSSSVRWLLQCSSHELHFPPLAFPRALFLSLASSSTSHHAHVLPPTPLLTENPASPLISSQVPLTLFLSSSPRSTLHSLPLPSSQSCWVSQVGSTLLATPPPHHTSGTPKASS